MQFFFFLSPFGTIAAGERGVHLRFTAVTGKVFGEGLYFRFPLIESVQMMDVKIQKYEMKSDAASKDLQTVHSVVALNFHIDPDRVANMYQDVGLQFKDRIIDPGMQEAIKASTAKFTAEELITKRELVRDEIKAQLKARLNLAPDTSQPVTCEEQFRLSRLAPFHGRRVQYCTVHGDAD